MKFKELSAEIQQNIIKNYKQTDKWMKQVTYLINQKVKKKKKTDTIPYKEYIINARCRIHEDKILLLSTFHFLTVADVENLLKMVYGEIPEYLIEAKLHRVCIFFDAKNIGNHHVYVFSLNGMEMDEDFVPLRNDIRKWITKVNTECISDLVLDDFINDEKEIRKFLNKTYTYNKQGEIV